MVAAQYSNKSGGPPAVGVLFTQFAPYHVDRCAALARRLAGGSEVLAVEVATASATYAWPPSGEVGGARKLTLFPGEDYEALSRWRRFRAQFVALRRCRWVLIGIGYDQPDVIALAFALRLVGVRPVLLTESKFDDRPRRHWLEGLKRLILAPYVAALVGGRRQAEYVRYLGFERRPVLPGYDGVGLARVRGSRPGALDGRPFAERPFVFVGRFVAKKGLDVLLPAYAGYKALAGGEARPLVLAGGGELEREVQAQIAALGLEADVTVTGFLKPEDVADRLSQALALVLPSREEQWGLVVNEAIAFSLPAIVSEAVGARDALVRNGINGFVVETGCVDSLAQALLAMAGDEVAWRRMVAASAERAWLGDAERFADGAEALIGSGRQAPELARFLAELGLPQSDVAAGDRKGLQQLNGGVRSRLRS